MRESPIFSGVHVLFFSEDAEADRAFFRDVLELSFVDAGDGWLIFALPPAEAGLHPADGDSGQSHSERRLAGAIVYFLCDDLEATVASLAEQNVEYTPFVDEPWGLKTTFRLPSGAEIGLYQPKHPTAIGR